MRLTPKCTQVARQTALSDADADADAETVLDPLPDA